MAIQKFAAVVVLALGVVGCANQNVQPTRSVTEPSGLQMIRVGERLNYSPPKPSNLPTLPERLDADYGLVWDQTIDILRTVGFEFSQLDEREGVILARYQGPPGDFVDCGTITAQNLNRSNRRELDASATPLQFGRDRLGFVKTVQRQLQLDSRLALMLTPEGSGTAIQSKTTYVLTKETAVYSGPETIDSSHRETIFFDSLGSSSFKKGTVCQPTGTLERLVVVASASG